MYCIVSHACFQNARIIRVYVMANGFTITAELTFPFAPGLCSAQRLPTSFTLSNILYVNGHTLQLTLYMIPFNCSFVSRALGFLKTLPNVFSDNFKKLS